MHTLWQIWKARCAWLYAQQPINPTVTLNAAHTLTNNVRLGTWAFNSEGITRPTTAINNSTVGAPSTAFLCWVDGSFSDPDRGGTGYWLLHYGRLQQYGLSHHSAASPFQMETVALLDAVRATLILNINECTFHTDSELLVKSLQAPISLQHADWRAYRELMQLAFLMLSNTGYHFQYTSRQDNLRPHNLANLARVEEINYTGYTFPLFLQHR